MSASCLSFSAPGRLRKNEACAASPSLRWRAPRLGYRRGGVGSPARRGRGPERRVGGIRRQAGTEDPVVDMKPLTRGSRRRQECSFEIIEEALGGHRLEGKLVEVAANKVIPGASPDRFLEHAEEEEPLVVGDEIHAIVGVATSQRQLQMSVGARCTESLDFVVELLARDQSEHLGVVGPIQGLHDAMFEVGREALVEPEVVPAGVGDEVA